MQPGFTQVARPPRNRARGGGPWSLPSLLVLLAAPTFPQALIQGVVETIEDGQRLPVAEAVIRAWIESDAIAVARSGRDGRYALEVPAETFELRLDKPGYVVTNAGGIEQPRLRRTCPPAGDCGQVDFLLERAAAVEIWLADPSGDPFPSAAVEIARKGDPEATEDGETDDRGVLRFYGLAPGPYRLSARAPMLHPSIGSLYEVDPAEVDLRPGENAPLHLSARQAGAFSFSAVIEGVELGRSRYWLQVRPLRAGGDASAGWGMFQNEPELQLPRLAQGEYVLALKPVNGSSQAQPVSLGRIKVDGNLAGLVLRPKPLSTLLVHVLFEDGAPDAADLSLRSDEGWTWGAYGAMRGKPDISIQDAPPGRYTLTSGRSDAFLLEEPVVQLAEGSIESIRVTLSARFGRIRGTIRGVGEAPVRVELTGPAGPSERSIGPDGAFTFDQLAPGEYTLCASRAGSRCPDDRRRRFPIEPGDDVELELGAPE